MTATEPLAQTSGRNPVGIDRSRIRDLYDDYAYLLDGGRYDGWLDLFVEDVDYRVIARENVARGLPLATMRCESRAMLADRIEAIRNTQFYVSRVMRHFVSGLHVEPGGGDDTDTPAADVRANVAVTESTADDPSRLHLVGEYRDRVVEADGVLRFARKHCVYDSPIILTSLIVPV